MDVKEMLLSSLFQFQSYNHKFANECAPNIHDISQPQQGTQRKKKIQKGEERNGAHKIYIQPTNESISRKKKESRFEHGIRCGQPEGKN